MQTPEGLHSHSIPKCQTEYHLQLQIVLFLRGRNQTTLMQYHVFRSAGVCVGVSDVELCRICFKGQWQFQKHSFPHLEICIYGLSLLSGYL